MSVNGANRTCQKPKLNKPNNPNPSFTKTPGVFLQVIRAMKDSDILRFLISVTIFSTGVFFFY